MTALGPISRLSLPYDGWYVDRVADWTAVHAAYTDLSADEPYVEDDGDWSGEHCAYTDSFVPSEDLQEELPDDQAVWAVAHGLQDARAAHQVAVGAREVAEPYRELESGALYHGLDCTVVEGAGENGSGGTLSLTLQRGDLPPGTTAVHVSVQGTPVDQTMVLPGSSTTVSLSLSGVPAGTHIVVVEALSPSGVLATTQITVYVPPSPEPSRDAAPMDPPEEPTAPPMALGEVSGSRNPAMKISLDALRRALKGDRVEQGPSVPGPAAGEHAGDMPEPGQSRATEASPPSSPGPHPPRIVAPDRTGIVRTRQTFAASAAAADLGPVVEHRVRTSGEWLRPDLELPRVRETQGSQLDDRGEHERPGHRERTDQGEESGES